LALTHARRYHRAYGDRIIRVLARVHRDDSIVYPEKPKVSELAPYFAYLAGAAASGAWVYRDAQKHGHGHPRSVAAGTAALFPVGLLLYILSR
jgi:hypothetical protein